MALQIPASIAALSTRIRKEFATAMVEAPIFSERIGIFSTIPSDGAFNTYSFMDGFGPMHEWVGPRHVESLKERAFTIYNKHYAKTIEANADELEDNYASAVSDAAIRTRLFTESGRKLKDDLAIDLLRNGQSRVGYDGQYFFDTDHPTDLDASGTQSNYEASAFALTAANFQTARARMAQFAGSNGRPFGSRTTVLVIPPQLEKTANDLFTAEFGASGATNTQNGQVRVEIVPELAVDATTWYLFDTSAMGIKPLVFQERKPLRLTAKLDAADDNVFWRNALVWGLDTRVGAGYGAWFKAFKAVG